MKIPKIGLGTWKLRDTKGQESIESALELGYRHIDTADWYKNHEIVGEAMKNSNIPREDIYLVTKIYPPLTTERIPEAAKRFLKELQTDYIDLLLVHWPDETPIAETLEAFTKLKNSGLAKEIGVSNYGVEELTESLNLGFDLYNHQFKFNPKVLDGEMVKFCRKNKITLTAYSPLGEGRALKEAKIKQIALDNSISPAQVILSWLLSKDIVVIPKATSVQHQTENFEAQNITLSKAETKVLDSLS